MPDNKITALYSRLSNEDERAGVSTSIENQNAFLKEYATRNGFPNLKFYTDDGWSGARFDNRPGLNAMREDIRAGKVATVIIKDQSRIGRDVVEIGLLKRDFDEYNVRFIAVSDNLDTANGFDVMSLIRDVFNEYYLADTSKKIKAVKQAQAARGERVNGNAPYGYLIDPENKHHLIPDPETAPVVQQIFDMFVQGTRLIHIQDWLRENEIVTVTELMYQRKGNGRHPRPLPELKYNWPEKSIYDLLTRKEYIGHTVTGKTVKVSYKSNKTLRKPEEEQHIFLNTHEPLIDEDVFDLAQKRIATRNRPTKIDEIDIFSGLIFCGDCGHKLYLQRGASKTKSTESYVCGRYNNGRNTRTVQPCTMHYIRKMVLSELVLGDIKRVTSYVQAHESEFIEAETKRGDAEAKKALNKNRRDYDTATARINEIDTIFRKLYEDNALGKLSEQQFSMLTSGLDEERAGLKQRLKELTAEINSAEKRGVNVDRFVKIVRRFTDIQELTYENLHELVDRILIYEPDPETNIRKVEIFYSFVTQIDTSQAPTTNLTYWRKGRKTIKSVVT